MVVPAGVVGMCGAGRLDKNGPGRTPSRLMLMVVMGMAPAVLIHPSVPLASMATAGAG